MTFYNSSILRTDDFMAFSTISPDWDRQEKKEKSWLIMFDSLFFFALYNSFYLSIPLLFLIFMFFSTFPSRITSSPTNWLEYSLKVLTSC